MAGGSGLAMADRGPKHVSVPAILARFLNRVAAMGRGVWVVTIIKGRSGARGILGWSVVETALEPKDALGGGVERKEPSPTGVGEGSG